MKLPNLTGLLSLQDAALQYGAAGFPVFELAPRDKKPATPHGFYDATTDVDELRTRWSRNPDFNIGMPMGERSGLMVLDIDIDRGGTESFSRLLEGREHFETWIIESGGGGHHLYFQYDPRLKSRKDFLRGLELKSDGTYVVAPPSIHPSARPYKVLFDCVVAPCPDWLRDAILASPAGQKRSEAIPERIPEGTRDSTLASLAGSLHHRGLAYAVVESALQSVNQELCDPPLPESQVTKIARSITRYERAQPSRTAFDYVAGKVVQR